MKPSTIFAPFALAIIGADPAQARVDAGIRFAIDAAGKIVEAIIEGTSRVGVRDMPLMTRQDLPPGVPEEEWHRCLDDLGGLTITITTNSATHIQFAGLPASCMNLANVLVGDGTGPFALPCGSDCLVYDDITEAERDEFLSIFQ